MPSTPDPVVEVTVKAEINIPPSVTQSAIVSFARHVLVSEAMSGPWIFGIHFVDDPTMMRAHAEFMGIDTPTDIMTFSYDGNGFGSTVGGSDEPECGGDLVICVDRAAENARDAGWMTEHELFFLICHGLLHILGWDDETDQQRANMLNRQSYLLAAWLAAGSL